MLKRISSFSERLKEALGDNTATDLAEKIGLSKQAISMYVNGKRTPKRPVIESISRILNVNPMWLMGYDVEKYLEIKAVKVPVLGRVQAGVPIEAVQDIIDEEEIHPKMALSGEYFALKIIGII